MKLFPTNLRSFLKRLEQLERILCRFVRGLLFLAMCSIVGGTAWLLIDPPWAGHQGESFYLCVIAALAFGCCVKPYRDAGVRMERATIFNNQEQHGAENGSVSSAGHDPSQFTVEEQFQILQRVVGVPNDNPFGISATTTVREFMPCQADLDELADELAAGATLEEAVEVVLPQAAGYQGLKRRVFLSLLRELLKRHQVQHAATLDEFTE